MKRITILLLLFSLTVHGQIITTIAGKGSVGYSGDGGLATNAEFNLPYSVKFDHSNNLYIADWKNHVIRKIDNSGIITTIAGTGSGGYSGDGGPASTARLRAPVDIAFDAIGNIYIDDNGNNAIRKVTMDGTITTIAGTGVLGYNGDGIPATSAKLYAPLGLVFDNAGNLYFSDEGNARVRKIDNSGIISTVVGTGVVGYSGDGGQATNAELRQPCWLTISPSGDLYIPVLDVDFVYVPVGVSLRLTDKMGTEIHSQ
jgi:hypothetical protein